VKGLLGPRESNSRNQGRRAREESPRMGANVPHGADLEE